MIVTAFEAQAMMGWSCILCMRILEIIEDMESGDILNVDDVIRHEKTQGLFDLEKGMTPQTRQSIVIVIQAIIDIKPDLLKEEKVEGAVVYIVA